MGQNASGMYIVDDSYNIVSFNKVAEQIYPRLKEGEKCYRCLMNQEVPCAMCPIYNKVEGPKTYIDPVSGKYETVDAVEIRLPDGKEGYAVVFGMAESDKEAVNAPIPDGVQGLRLASIINVLGNDYSSIYSVDRQTQQMRSYLESTNADTMTLLNVTQTYTEAIAAYVEENVNSIYGTRVGDEILQYLAKSIREILTDGLAARYSDDEFVIMTSLSTSEPEKILESVAKHISENAPISNLLVKYGVYKDVDKTLSINDICDRAVTAMKSIQLNYEKSIAYMVSAKVRCTD